MALAHLDFMLAQMLIIRGHRLLATSLEILGLAFDVEDVEDVDRRRSWREHLPARQLVKPVSAEQSIVTRLLKFEAGGRTTTLFVQLAQLHNLLGRRVPILRRALSLLFDVCHRSLRVIGHDE